MSDIGHDGLSEYGWRFRGRGPHSGPAAWPYDRLVALNLIILHEWEGTPRPVRPMPAGTVHDFDSLGLGNREYGVHEGLPRLLSVLIKSDVQATIIANGLSAVLFPDSFRDVVDRGHEVACHQWDQAIHPPTYRTCADEADHLDRALWALREVTGQPINGYMSPGPRPSPFTLDLLAEREMLWTADYTDSDVPYTIQVGESRLVSVGYPRQGLVDFDLLGMGSRQAADQLCDEVDALRDEARATGRPLRMSYAIHTHAGGSPAMASALDRFLDHVGSMGDVWVSTLGSMARHTLDATVG